MESKMASESESEQEGQPLSPDWVFLYIQMELCDGPAQLTKAQLALLKCCFRDTAAVAARQSNEGVAKAVGDAGLLSPAPQRRRVHP